MTQEHRATHHAALGHDAALPIVAIAVGLVILALSGTMSVGQSRKRTAPPGAPATQSNPAPRTNPASPPMPETRGQAPIGHRQPRAQDLPAGAGREEGGKATDEQRALDKKLEICRQC